MRKFKNLERMSREEMISERERLRNQIKHMGRCGRRTPELQELKTRSGRLRDAIELPKQILSDEPATQRKPALEKKPSVEEDPYDNIGGDVGDFGSKPRAVELLLNGQPPQEQGLKEAA